MKLITAILLAFFTLQTQTFPGRAEVRQQGSMLQVQTRAGFSNRQHAHERFTSQVNPNDYLTIEVNGQRAIVHKSGFPDYRPQFNLELVHSQPAASATHNFFSNGYEADLKYFAKHFKDCYPEQIFHCLANYRFTGFRQYVQSLQGFTDFIKSIGPELQSGSDLHRTMRTTNNLKSFEVLQNIYNQQCYDQAKIAREPVRQTQVANLGQQHFSCDGVRLLERYGVMEEFLDPKLPYQKQHFERIAQHLNETGEFWQDYQHDRELVEISNQAANFGIMANRALKSSETTLSQALLEVGQNFLALGKGIVKSGVRNLCSTLEMLCHPIETGANLAHLVKNIGVGIGKATYLMAQFQTAFDLGDEQLLDQASAQLDGYINQGRQLYAGIKQMLHDATPTERYEMLGGMLTDGVFLIYGGKINGILGRLAPIRKLHSYKGQTLDKLGQVGRDIHQIAGLTYTKGAKAVNGGFEVLQHNPWAIQGRKTITGAIQAGRRYLDSSNTYLAKLARHSTKCILDPERRLMRWGNQVKKLPKACIAKVKQFIGDEAVVIDAYGNKWTSKIDREEWLVQLSEKGQANLVLLNETAREVPKGMPISAKKLKPNAAGVISRLNSQKGLTKSPPKTAGNCAE